MLKAVQAQPLMLAQTQAPGQLTEWEVRPNDLQIATTPDGEDVVLGAGAFGAVCEHAACPQNQPEMYCFCTANVLLVRPSKGIVT